MDRQELADIAEELLELRDRAERAGSRAVAYMIVAATREAERDAGAARPLRADCALAQMLADEPAPTFEHGFDGR